MYTEAWALRQAKKALRRQGKLNRTELAQLLAPEWQRDGSRYHQIMEHLNKLGREGKLKNR